MILLIAIILGVVCLDQLTKWLVVIFIDCPYIAEETVCPDFASSTNGYVPIWQDVLHLVHHHNEGMAFGLLKDNRWVFMIFSTVAIIGILVYLIKFRPQSRWMQVSLAMIAGGGIGNMIDRVALGYVIDFISFKKFPWFEKDVDGVLHLVIGDYPTFNVADSFVCIGAAILIVYLLVDLIRSTFKPADKATADEVAQAVMGDGLVVDDEDAPKTDAEPSDEETETAQKETADESGVE